MSSKLGFICYSVAEAYGNPALSQVIYIETKLASVLYSTKASFTTQCSGLKV